MPPGSRASKRVATPETAAVRTAVMPPAFMIARVSPVSPSNSATNPWCRSSPRSAFEGKMAIGFKAQRGASPASVRWHQPEQARLARWPDDEAQRVVHLAAGQRREGAGHHFDALVHRQQPPYVLFIDHANAHASKNLPIRSRSSAERTTSRAASTGLRCSARFGPHTAPATPGLASTQAKASVAMSKPRESRLLAQAVEPIEDGVGDEPLVRAGSLRHARTFRKRLAAAVLAGQPAAGQRPEGQVRDPVGDAERQHALLVAALEQRVRVLKQRRSAVPKRLRDALVVVVRQTPRADQAFVPRRLEGGDRRQRAATAASGSWAR